MVLITSLAGCGLAHERRAEVHPTPAPDAGSPTPSDAAPPDAFVAPDAGSCTLFWTSLPSCPADTASAVGSSCATEGATCGVHCCEPGPPIVCEGGRWHAGDHQELCAIDCPAPTACGAGQCAPGRVCVQTDFLGGTGLARCVEPPAPIASCDDVPPGALSSDAHTCESCRCGAGPTIFLSCDCCDL